MAPFDETSIGQSHASVGGEYVLPRFYRIPENDPDFSKKKKNFRLQRSSRNERNEEERPPPAPKTEPPPLEGDYEVIEFPPQQYTNALAPGKKIGEKYRLNLIGKPLF